MAPVYHTAWAHEMDYNYRDTLEDAQIVWSQFYNVSVFINTLHYKHHKFLFGKNKLTAQNMHIVCIQMRPL